VGADTSSQLEGGAGNDTLAGGLAADTLYGGDGNDSVMGGAGDDLIIGGDGAGDDTYAGGDGVDTVKYSSAIAGIKVDLDRGLAGSLSTTNVDAAGIGNDTLTGIENIIAGNYGDRIIGSTAANRLEGLDGNDTLDGGTGADTMLGGSGDDTYVVDNAGDTVYESTTTISAIDAGGTDTVQSSVSYTLGQFLENLTLTGTAKTNATGNTLANTLVGNGAANTLDGGAGNDTLTGGLGNDTYVVDSTTDTITELANGGVDTIQSSVNFSLAATALANIENLTYTGSTAWSGAGNALANVITAGTGADTLDGGAGADSMYGGAGNDTYIVDNFSDKVYDVSAPGSTTDAGGTDTVQTSLNYSLGSYIENLTLTGTSGLIGIGNTLANTITGTSGNNTLNGGTGADTMLGGSGDDTYVVDNLGDVVTEVAGEGTDTVQVAIAAAGGTYTLGTNVENGTLTNIVVYNLVGNELNNVLTGNAANNTLNGGLGNDTLDGGAGADALVGGAGDDTYVVDNTADVVTEASGAGTDLVKLAAVVSTPYLLAANVENLQLMDPAGASGATGNSADNVIFMNGNTGNSAIDGASGIDTLSYHYAVFAGTGTATGVTLNLGVLTSGYSVASGGFGADQIKGVENLVGSAYADTLTGSKGANVLAGGMGRDSLTGGAGADKFLFNVMEMSANKDTITDFNLSQDKIQFSKSVFTNLTSTVDMASMFAYSTGISASTRLIYNSTSGVLSYDADGSGTQYQAIEVALIGVTSHAQLTASHFEIVA
jgi:Ca2+-binding RTX toxin-like protein